MSHNPFESPSEKKSQIEQISDDSPISKIPVIKRGSEGIRTREDLKDCVEVPLLEACQFLYDLNIKTLMSSANSNDVGENAYIDVDFDSLSEENKTIALSIGPIQMMHGSKPTPYVQIVFPVTPTTTVGDIRKAALDAVRQFKKQTLTWGRYTAEELASAFGISPEDISPDEWSEEFPYDPESKYYYQSKELLAKAREFKGILTHEAKESLLSEKIEEFENLLADFERTHDFEALHAITRFETKEERRTSIRAQALVDIEPLVQKLNALEQDVTVPEAIYTELRAKYRVIQDEIIGVLQDDPSGKGEIVTRRKYQGEQ